MAIKDNALRWWAAKTQKDIYVVLSNEIPDRRQREFLVKENFLFSAAKGYWILKRSEDAAEGVFPIVYWQVIEKILSRLGRCSVWGKSALTLLSGDQKTQKLLSVKTEKKTNRKVVLPLGFEISLVHDSGFDERLVKTLEITGRKIPVDIPEKTLIDTGRLKLGAEAQGFIAGTRFDLRMLEALYAMNPKPIVFKRIISMARDAGRSDLIVGLDRIIKAYTHYQVGRKEKIENELDTEKPVSLKTPWVIRQEQQIQKFARDLDKKFGVELKGLKRHPISKLLKQAKEHKQYDTYHSTTLEGYQVTPEEVEALLSGAITEHKEEEGEGPDQIKNRMAIVGYSKAFDFVVDKARLDFGKPYISEGLVKDTYHQLFKPSVDAGIADRITLVNYRNNPVYIRGTQYVPPSHEKLPELMASFETRINEIANPVVKAILGHYLFVAVHPYFDGNGRTARLLMNYLLLAAEYPWVTIRADQRFEYFKSLNAAGLEQDILPFGKFIIELMSLPQS